VGEGDGRGQVRYLYGQTGRLKWGEAIEKVKRTGAAGETRGGREEMGGGLRIMLLGNPQNRGRW